MIIKKPEFENDDFLLNFNDFSLTDKVINKILDDDYIKLKFEKFKNKDISKKGFEGFDNPSLSGISNVEDLRGTIYTFKSEYENSMEYENIIKKINFIRETNKNSRRMVIRIVSSFNDYFNSQTEGNVDVSCLNLIQYFENNVYLVFRASDIKNELFADIITIYNFFIKPIFKNEKCNLKIYATTSQNVVSITAFHNQMDYIQSL